MPNSPQSPWSTSDHSKTPELPYLTAFACGLCILIFLGINIQGNAQWDRLATFGYYPPDAIWEGKPWALLTSAFVHSEIWHLAFNVYWLWILGGCLEHMVGPLRWLLFFITAAWVSSAAQLMTGDQGIGMSGVCYALFGFGWMVREQQPAFKQILNEQTIQIFLLWLVGCIVATFFHLANIGNAAHVGGLVFGAAVGSLYTETTRTQPGRGVQMRAATLALLALSFVPLFWCPLSGEWDGHQAYQAQEREQYPTAIYWYRQALARGADPSWVWSNLAIIYSNQDDQRNYQEALNELRKVDATAADKMVQEDQTDNSSTSHSSTPSPHH
ncbi:MAG: rhomboid family intramembrane serine protease [Abitibacteriaceae bacterium]|nr:rhomboid family intramembrane serine protease [Abditibacteriaceae bacterium]MBV9863732.1 rhomboid family intramembrane serine protease [Abditibacteriaceae bacterium]